MQIQLEKYSIEGWCLIKMLKEADKVGLINCEWETKIGCQDRETLICKVHNLWFIFGDYGENSESFSIGIYNKHRNIAITVFDFRGWLYTQEELKHKKWILSFLESLFNNEKFVRVREPLLNIKTANGIEDILYYEDKVRFYKSLDMYTVYPSEPWFRSRSNTIKFLNKIKL